MLYFKTVRMKTAWELHATNDRTRVSARSNTLTLQSGEYTEVACSCTGLRTKLAEIHLASRKRLF